jgi:hypothetical protein
MTLDCLLSFLDVDDNGDLDISGNWDLMMTMIIPKTATYFHILCEHILAKLFLHHWTLSYKIKKRRHNHSDST